MLIKDKLPKASIERSTLQRRIFGPGEFLQSEASLLEPLTQVILICFCLWSGFWIQFLISCSSNLPAIYALSGGKWYFPDVDFYLDHPGSYPFSIAGNFLFYSSFGSVLALFFGWIFTKGAPRKWRLRLAVVVFVTILMGWSGAAYSTKRAAWTVGLEARMKHARNAWWQASERNESEWVLRYYRLEVERLEALVEQNPYRKAKSVR